MTPAIWIPAWYELDQSVVLGERDVFLFFAKRDSADTSETFFFWNALCDHSCFEAEATVSNIQHSVFGQLRAILAEGLDYSLITGAGTCIRVEAEESPGYVYDREETLRDREFLVELENVTLLSPDDPRALSGRSPLELKRLHAARKQRWAELLGSAYPHE